MPSRLRATRRTTLSPVAATLAASWSTATLLGAATSTCAPAYMVFDIVGCRARNRQLWPGPDSGAGGAPGRQAGRRAPPCGPRGAQEQSGSGARLALRLARQVVDNRGGRDRLAGAGRALDQRQRRRQHRRHRRQLRRVELGQARRGQPARQRRLDRLRRHLVPQQPARRAPPLTALALAAAASCRVKPVHARRGFHPGRLRYLPRLGS